MEKSSRPTISFCMIVKDEAENLPKCLECAKKIANELIVVDTGSSDNSKEIAKKFSAKVFDFEWKDDFSAARNFSISKASSEWIFFLDADEVIAASDLQKVRKLAEQGKADGYYFIARNYTRNVSSYNFKPCIGTYGEENDFPGYVPSASVRLFRNNPKHKFQNRAHESVYDSIIAAKGKVEKAEVPLHHYGLALSDEDAETKMGRNLKLLELQIKEKPKEPRGYFEAAVAAENLGEKGKAMEYFRKTAELNPKYRDVYAQIGRLQVKLGEESAAAGSFMQAKKLNSKCDFALTQLASLWGKAGNYDKAIYFFREALTVDQENTEALYGLALALYKKEDYEKAEKAFQLYVKKAPLDALGYVNFSKVLAQNNREQAAKLLRLGLDKNARPSELIERELKLLQQGRAAS